MDDTERLNWLDVQNVEVYTENYGGTYVVTKPIRELIDLLADNYETSQVKDESRVDWLDCQLVEVYSDKGFCFYHVGGRFLRNAQDDKSVEFPIREQIDGSIKRLLGNET
jgi:hypothetical protein